MNLGLQKVASSRILKNKIFTLLTSSIMPIIAIQIKQTISKKTL